MKKCKICLVEKDVSLMKKGALLCRECRNAARRTGRPCGRPPGGIPWNKSDGLARYGWRSKEWSQKVKERDNYVCQYCGCVDRKSIHAHHIVPWCDNVELRFELSNGISLCRICHKKEDRRIHPEMTKLKGRIVTQETRDKIRKSLKGRSPPNKGKKGQKAWNKGLPQTDDVKKKISISVKKYFQDLRQLKGN